MKKITRRDALQVMAAAVPAAVLSGCRSSGTTMTNQADAILHIQPLGTMWKTLDPFLMCVHHNDHYPAGNDHLGPATSLSGRNLGQDFSGKDGWSMYHGEEIPGFPQHPHRGFETVTVVRTGLLDHADSLGAAARYGSGDVQWLTAGSGILHAEMFPLLQRDRDNPLELFQIWLNLPSRKKMSKPYFSMLWNHIIPHIVLTDEKQNIIELRIIAGSYQSTAAPPPPPNSWAAEAESDLAIWTLKLSPRATWTLPAAKAGTNRSLYFFSGSALQIAGREIAPSQQIVVKAERDITLCAGADEVEILLLQGKPIQEPVVQYGPFVMNTREEIQQAVRDYQRTRFGGWPWPSEAPVHAVTEGRFAKYIDGRVERIG